MVFMWFKLKSHLNAVLFADGVALCLVGVVDSPSVGARVAQDIAVTLAEMAHTDMLLGIRAVRDVEPCLAFQTIVLSQSLLGDELLACFASFLHQLFVLAWIVLLELAKRMESFCSHLACGFHGCLAGCFASDAVIVAVLLADTLGDGGLLATDDVHVLGQSECALEPLHGDERDAEDAHHIPIECGGV